MNFAEVGSTLDVQSCEIINDFRCIRLLTLSKSCFSALRCLIGIFEMSIVSGGAGVLLEAAVLELDIILDRLEFQRVRTVKKEEK